MHKFVRNLLTEWRKLDLPFAGETCLIALSGGADSVSLLAAIADLRRRKKLLNRFLAAHYNHNLRGAQSERDAEFVRDLCAKLDFELILEQGSVAKKGNLEQNARRARYEFLTRAAENLGARAIFTAHTLNDQAETFLINLIRGSGLRGLSGIQPVLRDFGSGTSETKNREVQNSDSTEKSENRKPKPQIPKPKTRIELVRPLLNWAKRSDTENFCRELEIEYRRDAMNDDLAFLRVRIRKILLPLLEDFNPKIVATLAQTARVLSRELEFIEEASGRNAERETAAPELKELKKLSKPQLYVFLRAWLERRRGDLRQIDSKHLEAIENLMTSRKSGKTVELPGKGTVRKKAGKLIFEPKTLK